MRRFAFAVCVGALLGLATAAAATERSTALQARGLIDYDGARFEAALASFDAAVAADSADAQSLFYRGLTKARLEDWSGAAADLAAVLERDPSFTAAHVELGFVQVRRDDCAAARPHLDRAISENVRRGAALRLRSICRSRAGDADGALADLDAAAATGVAKPAVDAYYRGLAHLRADRLEAAMAHFEQARDLGTGTTVGTEAGQQLEALQGSGRVGYRLYARTGYEYDSNVNLGPDDDTGFAVSNQSDSRAVLRAGGSYTAYQRESTWIVLDYDFYQSLHFDLDEFDLQNHRASVRAVYEQGPLTTGLVGRVDYYFLDGDDFLLEGGLLPWMSITHGDYGHTDVHYRLRTRDFQQPDFSDFRDGDNHAAAITHYKHFGQRGRYVGLRYRFDVEKPDGRTVDHRYAYDGHEGAVLAGWDLPWETVVRGVYAYRDENYDGDSALSLTSLGRVRDDEEHSLHVEVTKRVNGWLSVQVGYDGQWNDSTDPTFEFDRHIVGVSVEVQR